MKYKYGCDGDHNWWVFVFIVGFIAGGIFINITFEWGSDVLSTETLDKVCEYSFGEGFVYDEAATDDDLNNIVFCKEIQKAYRIYPIGGEK